VLSTRKKKDACCHAEDKGKRERNQIYVHELKKIKIKIKISIHPNMLKPNGCKVQTKYLLVWGVKVR
jgi:RNase P subunit RPR2